MFESETRGVTIARPVSEVFELLLDPANYSLWGFADPGGIRRISGAEWEVETAIGLRRIRFPTRNVHGILDIASRTGGDNAGDSWLPMGVWAAPNGAGTELAITCFRRPGSDDDEWSSLRTWINADFLALQSVLETRGRAEPVYEARAISLSVARPLSEVYDFLAEPTNFSSWAFVEDAMMEPLGQGEWCVETSVGRRFMKFAVRNRSGILSYQSRLSLDETPHLVPMRVLPNGGGTEIVHVFIRRPGATDEDFNSLIEWVTTDLLVLKSILEAGGER